MKRRMNRRLTLNRETVRALQDADLKQVAGGAPGPRRVVTVVSSPVNCCASSITDGPGRGMVGL